MTLVFLMKGVGAIKTIDEMNDLLLTDELLMSMCGFNVPVHKTEEELNISREQTYAKYTDGPVTGNS